MTLRRLAGSSLARLGETGGNGGSVTVVPSLNVTVAVGEPYKMT